MPETWILNGRIVTMPDDWREREVDTSLMIYENDYGTDYDMPWLEKIHVSMSDDQILRVIENEDPDLFSVTRVTKGKIDADPSILTKMREF
ncbi:MAG: hypothetical protein ACTSRA_00220 [Promethearchaeota archaeon]|nr:MAG: hypothetical protein [Helarchaeota virus Nidhogg Meg22_1012]URC17379.1 MAG: hypothetical protein [Helarchaeota virus Nidhogg Meg22_1214]